MITNGVLDNTPFVIPWYPLIQGLLIYSFSRFLIMECKINSFLKVYPYFICNKQFDSIFESMSPLNYTDLCCCCLLVWGHHLEVKQSFLYCITRSIIIALQEIPKISSLFVCIAFSTTYNRFDYSIHTPCKHSGNFLHFSAQNLNWSL